MQTLPDMIFYVYILDSDFYDLQLFESIFWKFYGPSF